MTQDQENMCGEYNFRLMPENIFRCIDKPLFKGTPADLCLLFGVEVPNNAQFLRIIDFEEDFVLEYRAYNFNKVRINIWKKAYDY